MMDGETLRLFEQSIAQATDRHTGAALDAQLAALGWADALADDPTAAVSVLFVSLGRANSTASALDLVLGHALGHPGPAVLLPPFGEWGPPGRLESDRLHARGVATGPLAPDAAVLVVAYAAGETVLLQTEAASLAQRPLGGMDPHSGLTEVVAEGASGRVIGPVDWRSAVGVGQLAIGHQMVGASRRLLQLASQHALERVQFGQPVARYQAVRHRLADTLVAIEAAESALDAAWLDGSYRAAGMAKAIAGRSARLTARHSQQVLAGTGFTTEHPLHNYVKRVLVLEQILGGTRPLTRDLGRWMLERRAVPSILPL